MVTFPIFNNIVRFGRLYILMSSKSLLLLRKLFACCIIILNIFPFSFSTSHPSLPYFQSSISSHFISFPSPRGCLSLFIPSSLLLHISALLYLSVSNLLLIFLTSYLISSIIFHVAPHSPKTEKKHFFNKIFWIWETSAKAEHPLFFNKA